MHQLQTRSIIQVSSLFDALYIYDLTHPVRHEREGAVGVASYYYLQASRLLLQAVELGAQPELKEHAVQYKERGELLVAKEAGASRVTAMAPGAGELGRAYRLVNQGVTSSDILPVWSKKPLSLMRLGRMRRL